MPAKIKGEGLMRDPSEYRGAMFLENVPPELKKAYKAACALNGKSMREMIFKFMKIYAESKGQRPKLR